MSQDVKVYRTLQFYNKGGATRMSTIDTDDSATILYFRPETDDTGFFAIGDGTKDMDVKIFLGTSAVYMLADVGNAQLALVGVNLVTDSYITMGTASKLVLPVKATGSSTQGDIWYDTSDNYIHFYTTREIILTGAIYA